MIKLAPALALLLASCTSPDVAVTDTDPTDPCGATGYSSLKGAPLAAVTLPADLNSRILQPGSVATTDFIRERLNIEVNADGIITGLSCG